VLTAYLAISTWPVRNRGLGLDVPVPVPDHGAVSALDVQAPIEWLDVLGGLIYEYRRAA
jgi:hypothetical protein